MQKTFRNQIDSHLNFKEHIESLCKKASKKINVLSRLASSMNSFVIFHFSFFPVVWMFHSRKLNTRISRFQERFLRVVFKDFDSSFEKLLRKDSSTTLHQRNLQKLMTAIFRVKTGIAPELNFLMYLIIWGISLNVAVVYHVLKSMALKRHLL